MTKHDGGAAFPHHVTHPQGWAETQTHGGMTLRQYYAAHAPITMADAQRTLLDWGRKVSTVADILDMLAQLRFLYADEMIKAREAGDNEQQ